MKRFEASEAIIDGRGFERVVAPKSRRAAWQVCGLIVIVYSGQAAQQNVISLLS